MVKKDWRRRKLLVFTTKSMRLLERVNEMKFGKASTWNENIKPVTGIVLTMESLDSITAKDVWEVWYKGVKFGVFSDLQSAHDRLQKLLSLDSTDK